MSSRGHDTIGRRFSATRLLMLASGLLLAAGCGGESVPPASVPGTPGAAGSETQETPAVPERRDPVALKPEHAEARSPARLPSVRNPQVVIETTLGSIRVELDEQRAPQTVHNFLTNYVDRKAYDGTIVHYVDPGYMIAFGGFDESYHPIETRSPVLNEADNGLKNVAGTIAMARLPDYVHSATSQFFINVVDNPKLDYQETEEGGVNGYCVFGRVVEGMDVVRRIAASKTGTRKGFPQTPDPPIVVRSIRRVVTPSPPRAASVGSSSDRRPR